MPSKKSYFEKLKDPRWQKFRLEVFNRAGWKCQSCDSTDRTLHAHHRYYVSKREPWDYPIENMMALCERCHDEETKCMPDPDEISSTTQEWETVIGRMLILNGNEWYVSADIVQCVERGCSPRQIVKAILHTLENLQPEKP